MKPNALAALTSLYHNYSDRVIYLNNEQVITDREFKRLVNSVSCFLDDREEHLIAIHTNSTHNAAALVLGSWLAKKSPVLLPNNLPATVNSFININNHDAIFCDDSSVEQIPVHTSTEEKSLSLGAAQLAFFTSGSTGKPIFCYKDIGQLLAEIDQLELTFGSELSENFTFFSGVSHQHIYGFLFKLLWPLLTQRKVLSPCYNGLSELPIAVNDLCWITSPAQLKRLQSKPNNQLTINCIFSSGGPLGYDQALKCKELFNVYPFEVYGSTETGGIAYRQQTQNNQPYKIFSNVRFKKNDDGLLEIKSPHLPDQNWFEVQDKIKLISAESFMLLGRADRIVKVEGKRISLTEIENYLIASEFCQEVFALQLNRPNRQIIAAAIALSETGRKFMATQGRKATIAELGQHLNQVVDPIMVPKRWRFLSDIPRNVQHKINTAEIEAYFDSPGHNIDPVVLDNSESNSNTAYRLFVPRDLIYFHGHFPQLPILPGVIQIKWVLNLLAANHGITQIKDLKNLKFNKPILPGTNLELILEQNNEKHTFRFSYTSKQTSFSSGELIYTLTDR